MEQSTWTDEVLDFAVALKERAAVRSEPFFRPECQQDVIYLQKAAQLLEMITRSYIRLSAQINYAYESNIMLCAAAHEAVKIVENQVKMHTI